MRMPAAGFVGRGRDSDLADVTPVFDGIPVKMVGGLLDGLVDVGVEMLAVHALQVRAGDRVPEVTDHGVDEEQLAVFVPVHAPRIRRAVAHDLEGVPRWMEAPEADIHRRPLVRCRTRSAH